MPKILPKNAENNLWNKAISKILHIIYAEALY